MSETQERQADESSIPSVARVYDWLLGGTSNYQVDRDLGEVMVSRAPELPDAARANRSFHQRAARYLAELGIRQFIDLGSGLPTPGSTHEIVFGTAQVASARKSPGWDCGSAMTRRSPIPTVPAGCTARWPGNSPDHRPVD